MGPALPISDIYQIERGALHYCIAGYTFYCSLQALLSTPLQSQSERELLLNIHPKCTQNSGPRVVYQAFYTTTYVPPSRSSTDGLTDLQCRQKPSSHSNTPQPLSANHTVSSSSAVWEMAWRQHPTWPIWPTPSNQPNGPSSL
jgi:hypothetical protein